MAITLFYDPMTFRFTPLRLLRSPFTVEPDTCALFPEPTMLFPTMGEAAGVGVLQGGDRDGVPVGWGYELILIVSEWHKMTRDIRQRH